MESAPFTKEWLIRRAAQWADNQWCEVHIYHVAVPVGDCSIHLLVKEKDDDSGKPLVIRALLVDGGRNNGYAEKARDSIEKTIQTINDNYRFCLPGDQPVLPGDTAVDHLRFDGWIITHWDADHYWGALDIFMRDVDEKIAKKQDPTSWRCDLFKYDLDGHPLTTLYCPNWQGYTPFYKGHHPQLYSQEYKRGESDYMKISPWADQHHPCYVGFRYQPGTGGQPLVAVSAFRARQSVHRAEKVCRLVCGWNALKGMDFFTGIGLRDGVYDSIPNINDNLSTFLNDLGKAIGNDHYMLKGLPIFVCVGAEGQVAGKDVTPIAKPLHSTVDNYLSIMALTIWRSIPAMGGMPPDSPFETRISYFAGGDAHADSETSLAQFIGEGNRITTVKASHHGSRSSTSYDLLEITEPKNIFFSAGKEYGHPSWPLICFLQAFYRGQRKKYGEVKKPLHALRPPYYLLSPKPSAVKPALLRKLRQDNTPDVLLDYYRIIEKVEDQVMVPPIDGSRPSAYLDIVPLMPVAYSLYTFATSTPFDENADLTWTVHLANLVGQYWDDMAQSWDNAEPDGYLKMIASADLTRDGEFIRVTVGSADKGSYHEGLENLNAGMADRPSLDDYLRLLAQYQAYFSPRVKAMKAVMDRLELQRLKRQKKKKKDELNLMKKAVQNLPTKRKNTTEKELMVQFKVTAGKKKKDTLMKLSNSMPTNTRDAAPGPNVESMMVMNSHAVIHSEPGSLRAHPPVTISETPWGKVKGFFSLRTAPESTHIEQLIETPAVAETVAVNDADQTLVISDFHDREILSLLSSKKVRINLPPGSAPSGTFQSHLSANDEMSLWLRSAFPHAVCSVSGGVVDSPAMNPTFILSTWDLVVELPISPLSGERMLRFSTKEDQLRMQFGTVIPSGQNGFTVAVTTTEDSIDGGVTDRLLIDGTIIMGLDTTGAISAWDPNSTVADIIDLVGLSVPEWLRVALGLVNVEIKTSSNDTHHRCAIWFQPVGLYSTTLRLEMGFTDEKQITDFISKYLPQFSVSNSRLIAKRDCSYVPSSGKNILVDARPTFIIGSTITLMSTDDPPKKILETDAMVHIGASGFEVTLQWNHQKNPLSALITWMNNTVSGDSIPDLTSFWHGFQSSSSQNTEPEEEEISPIALRQVSLGVQDNNLSYANIIFQVNLPFGAAKGTRVPFMLDFSWRKGVFSLEGSLLSDSAESTEQNTSVLDPDYDDFAELKPILEPGTTSKLQYGINLLELDPDHPIKQENVPRFLPKTLKEVNVRIALSTRSTEISFSTVISLDKQPETSGTKLPMITLDELELDARYFKEKDKPTEFTLRFLAETNLNYPEPTADGVTHAVLSLELIYQLSNLWILHGTAADLNMGALARMFETGPVRDALVNLTKNIRVDYLDVEYIYQGGEPSHLSVRADIVIGGIELDLIYIHSGKAGQVTAGDQSSSNKAAWSLNARIHKSRSPTDQRSNPQLSEVIRDMFGEDVAADLPAFIGQTTLQLDSLEVELNCTPSADGKYLIFAFNIVLGSSFRVNLVQVRKLTKTDETGSPVCGDLKRTLRLLRLSIDSLPEVENVPVIEKLKTPFEQLDFIWSSEDVSVREITAINEVYPNDPFLFQKKDGQSESIAQAGFHFILVMNQNGVPVVALDYKYKSTSTAAQPGAVPRPSSSNPQPDPSSTPSSMVPAVKQAGPLSISRLGLQYNAETLHILVDAMVRLGPVQMAVKGFTVHLGFKDATMNNLRAIKPSVTMNGLALAYKSGMTELAGCFEYVPPPNERYAGGLSVSMPPYTFLAQGVYQEVKPPVGDSFRSLFAHAMLDGPLMELGYAEVRNITGAFGYNSTLRLPDVAQVTSFPLLSHAGLPAGMDDPLQHLGALTSGSDPWVKPQQDSIWLAAGLTVRAFQSVNIQALVTVEFNDNPKVAIIAEAVACLPATPGTDKSQLFLLVDLGMIAVLDPQQGSFQCEGQLSPASFILHPSCHLTGGFAMCAWFGNSEHNGDWVFSVGGYHPAYQRPSHYPNPPRLGISWQYDEHITIKGEAYLAITPQMVMAGGLLQLLFQMGKLRAYFDAHMDLMIVYQPFQFSATAGVRVGVAYELNLLFCTKAISVELGAEVYLHGPPLAGTVHVEFYVFGFDIAFGPSYSPRAALTVHELWAFLQQKSDSGENADHIFAASRGILPRASPTKEVASPWLVRSGTFSFQVHSRAALTSAECKIESGQPELEGCARVVGNSENNSSERVAVYSKPMQLSSDTSLKSDLEISIERNGQRYQFCVEQIFKRVPRALWGEYNPNDPNDEHSNKPPHIPQLMGVTLTVPPSKASINSIPGFTMGSLMKASTISVPLVPDTPTTLTTSSSETDTARKEATKDKLRGIWGSAVTSTATVDTGNILNAFSAAIGKQMPGKEKESGMKFRGLKSRPPLALFHRWDFYYSVGAPGLVGSV